MAVVGNIMRKSRSRRICLGLLLVLTSAMVVVCLLVLDQYHLSLRPFFGHLFNSSFTWNSSVSTCYVKTLRVTAVEQQSAATARYKLIPSYRSVSRSSMSATGIPRIIHQTWKEQGTVPVVYRKWMSTWSVMLGCDDWEYWFWTNKDMRRFAAQIYPQQLAMLAMYDSYPQDIYRADAFRYLLLYKYGGLYADLDVDCLRSLTLLVDQWDCGIADEPLEHVHFAWHGTPPLLSPALMICRPSHGFFNLIIENLRSKLLIVNQDAFHSTGPGMPTDTYTNNQNKNETACLKILNHDQFHPTLQFEKLWLINQCNRMSGLTNPLRLQFHNMVCQRLKSPGYNSSSLRASAYTDHHWTNIYMSSKKNLLEPVFNVEELAADVNAAMTLSIYNRS